MDSDDAMTGRLLTRREVLALLGASGATLATGAAFVWPPRRPSARVLPPCVVRPAQTEGPYFVEEQLTRSDIRIDPSNGAVSPGTPLALTFVVSRIAAGGCEPLPDALVDVWHCDADGLYSDVTDPSFNTLGRKFLRGNQTTDRQGEARFRTVYPGWYPGRAVHIHFKIRAKAGAARTADFTSQVYFDEQVTDRVHLAEPYNRKSGRRTRNEADRIFARGGDQLLLVTRAVEGGYAAAFDVGLQLD